MRYSSDGVLDTTFSGDGIATAALGVAIEIGFDVALQSDDRIVAVGYVGSDLAAMGLLAVPRLQRLNSGPR